MLSVWLLLVQCPLFSFFIVYFSILVVVGNIHKFVYSFFTPSSIHSLYVNTTCRPYSHNFQIEISECCFGLGNMYAILDSSGRWFGFNLHIFVAFMMIPSGKFMGTWVVRILKLF